MVKSLVERFGRKALGGLILSAAGVTAVPRLYVAHRLDKIEEIYGTLDRPNFTIEAEVPRFELFSQECEREGFDDNPLAGRLEGIHERVDEIERKLENEKARFDVDAPTRETCSEIVENCFSYVSDINELRDEIEELTKGTNGLFELKRDRKRERIRLYDGKLESDEANYGPVIEFSKQMFSDLTGKAVPPSLDIRILEDLKDKGIEGGHTHITESVFVEDGDYATVLSALMHELGHVAYQGIEDFHRWNRHRAFELSNELKGIEEAAAYLFSVAGLQKVSENYPGLDERMSLCIRVDRDRHLKDFRKGSDEEHDIGWALAEALLQHFDGNAAEAFNYLSTRNRFEDIDPAIIEIYESFRFEIADQSFESCFDQNDLSQRLMDLAGESFGLGMKVSEYLGKM